MVEIGVQMSDHTKKGNTKAGGGSAHALPFLFTDEKIAEAKAQFAKMEASYAEVKKNLSTIDAGKLRRLFVECSKVGAHLSDIECAIIQLSAANITAEDDDDDETFDDEGEIRIEDSDESESELASWGKSVKDNLTPIEQIDLIDPESTRTCFSSTFL